MRDDVKERLRRLAKEKRAKTVLLKDLTTVDWMAAVDHLSETGWTPDRDKLYWTRNERGCYLKYANAETVTFLKNTLPYVMVNVPAGPYGTVAKPVFRWPTVLHLLRFNGLSVVKYAATLPAAYVANGRGR